MGVVNLMCVQGERRPEEFGLPDMVQQYHSLFPLEDLHAAAEQPSAAFGVCSMLIRGVAPQLQGQAVTLRRLDSRQARLLSHTAILIPWFFATLPLCSFQYTAILKHCHFTHSHSAHSDRLPF